MQIVESHENEAFELALRNYWIEADSQHDADGRKVHWGFLLKDEQGAVIGGVGGYTRWNWLYVSNLIVRKEFRGKDYGTQLMAQAESFGREKKMLGMRLQTLSFQAPEFYKKVGFEEYGRLEDCPPGAALVLLMKRF